MQAKPSLATALLLAVPYVGLFGSGLLLPVLPKISQALDVSFTQATYLLSSLSLASGITLPIAGYLSDRWTRTIVLVPSLLLYGLAGLMAGLAGWLLPEPFGVLLFARILQGIGSAGTVAQVIALAGDLYPSKRRAQVLGLLETSNAAAKASGPLIGATLGAVLWYLPFFVYPVIAVPLGIALWLVLGRLPSEEAKKPLSLRAYVAQFWAEARGQLLPLLAVMLIGMLAVLFVLVVLALLSRELAGAGVHGFRRGVLIAMPEVVFGIVALLTGRWLRSGGRRGNRRATLGGLLVMASALSLLAEQESLAWLMAGALAVGAAAGAVLASGNIVIAAAMPAEERGLLSALYGAIRSLGAAMLSVFFLVARRLGSEALLFWMSAGLVAALSVLVWFVLFNDGRRQSLE